MLLFVHPRQCLNTALQCCCSPGALQPTSRCRFPSFLQESKEHGLLHVQPTCHTMRRSFPSTVAMPTHGSSDRNRRLVYLYAQPRCFQRQANERVWTLRQLERLVWKFASLKDTRKQPEIKRFWALFEDLFYYRTGGIPAEIRTISGQKPPMSDNLSGDADKNADRVSELRLCRHIFIRLRLRQTNIKL